MNQSRQPSRESGSTEVNDFPQIAERVVRKKWVKRIKRWFKYAISVDRTEFEQIMNSIAPEDAAEIFTESRPSTNSSSRGSTPPEIIMEENYEIFRPKTRSPTPLTPLSQELFRNIYSRKAHSSEGIRINKSFASSVFPTSSDEITWQTTSQNAFKHPKLKENENDVQFITQYYAGEIVKDVVLERIKTWLSLATTEEMEKFKDVFRRLKKHLSPTTYSSLWLETSPKYQRNRIYQDVVDSKEFASRKFVLPDVVTEARKIMEKQEEEERINSRKLENESSSKEKISLPAKLAPAALLTSYATFTSTMGSEFASMALSGNKVVHGSKNESHFKIGIENKTRYSPSTRSTFTPKDPEKYRLKSQFGEYSVLTSTIGATSNFTLASLDHLQLSENTPENNFKIAPLQIFQRQEMDKIVQRPFSK